MAKSFNQKPESKRFIQVLDHLVREGMVENDAQFCKRTGYSAQSLSQIRVGKRNVTVDLLSKLYMKFGGNPIYILSGRGEKLIEDEKPSTTSEPDLQHMANPSSLSQLQKKNDRLDKIMESYARQAEHNATFIRMQDEEIKELTMQIQKLSSGIANQSTP